MQKYFFKRPFLLIFLFLLGFSCTQYKNAFINREFHNMTARFNGYFYAKESVKEGVLKIETAYKDDYNKILPIFLYPTKESAKNTFAEFDKAIKKASTCILRHAIKNSHTKQEIPNTGRWIDDCWNTIGKSNFYKREIFSGIEAFDYVQSVYKGEQKYEAWLWLAKSYLELNALTSAQEFLLKLESEKKLPKKYRGHFEALYAEFYMKQNEYDDVIKRLKEAIKHTQESAYRARYHFIIAQLYEQKEDEQKAKMYYHLAIRCRPAYEMVFYAKMKESLLHKDPASIARAKKELLHMTKDIKNEDLRDVIYYTLGQIEEKDGDMDQAIAYYKKSVKTSVSNQPQKARSFLKLADINFDRESYQGAAGYYDSTVAIIKEDYPNYKDIVSKKKSLDGLVGFITTIKGNDSLLRIANMDSMERNRMIAKIIKDVYEDEKKAAELKQQSLNQNANLLQTNQPFSPQNPTSSDKWYFYNPLLKTQGLQDFVKRWGQTRKNEDNWRRANKGITFDQGDNTGPDKKDSLGGKSKKDSVIAKSNDVHKPEYYLKNLPFLKSEQDSANKRILEAYYGLGSLYREQLNNSKKAAETFETMNSRYPKNPYEAASLYQMYLIYLSQKSGKAQHCKDVLLSDYPNSDYAKIINDPNFTVGGEARNKEVKDFYEKTYELYMQKNYNESFERSKDALIRYGKNDYTAKFAFIKAVSTGYLYGVDSLEQALRVVTIRYNKSEVYDQAKAMLDAVKRQKHEVVTADTAKTKSDNSAGSYTYQEEAKHYCMVILDKAADADPLKNSISDFNNQYFSLKNYEVLSIPHNDKVLLTVRTFDDKDDAMGYYNFLMSKTDVFKMVDKKSYHLLVISTENVGVLLKKDNFDEYKIFFNAKYLGIKQ